MTYYQTFVAPVPQEKLEDYFALAKQMPPIRKAPIALAVVDVRPDNARKGKVTSFPQAVMCMDGEVPAFGFMTFRDKAHWGAIMAKTMVDPAMGP